MRTILKRRHVGITVLVLALVLAAACGSDDDTGSADGRPTIVVTTSILGDIVRQVAGDAAHVDVVMPLGSDPHDFQPSTKQAEQMTEADLLVVNGAHFEQGLEELIERSADADVPQFSFADHVELLPFAGHEDEHEEEGHEGEGEAEHDDDPHLWTDPRRVAEAVPALAEQLSKLDGVSGSAIAERAGAYVEDLDALDKEIEEQIVARIPAEERVLVTNHEVFGYFADRYGFEVVGTVIPSGSTLAEPSSAELEELADVIRNEKVPAIFAETSSPARLADRLASSVGNVEVVELYTESLGEPGSPGETYIDMMSADAQRISEGLGYGIG